MGPRAKPSCPSSRLSSWAARGEVVNGNGLVYFCLTFVVKCGLVDDLKKLHELVLNGET